MTSKFEIKLKSDRSKRAVKKSTKKVKKSPKTQTKQEQQSWLSRMLDFKESQWHDDDYDAGKDW